MNYIKILNNKEKKEILEKLKKQFSVESIPGELFMRGRERIFLFSGSFSNREVETLGSVTFVERVGVYFAKKDEKSEEIRLSIEGSQILGNQIKKNIFELDDNQAEEWMKGRELLVKTGKKGFLIMKYENNFLGTGKASEEKIGNFIPKNRRLREKNG